MFLIHPSFCLECISLPTFQLVCQMRVAARTLLIKTKCIARKTVFACHVHLFVNVNCINLLIHMDGGKFRNNYYNLNQGWGTFFGLSHRQPSGDQLLGSCGQQKWAEQWMQMFSLYGRLVSAHTHVPFSLRLPRQARGISRIQGNIPGRQKNSREVQSRASKRVWPEESGMVVQEDSWGHVWPPRPKVHNP